MDHFHQRDRAPETRHFETLDVALMRERTYDHDQPYRDDLFNDATLVVTGDGRPIRTIVTGRRVIPTGVFASRKAGRPLPWESLYERAFFFHSEVDPDVVDYRAQLFRFDFLRAKRAYIVDCVRQLANGVIEVVEIKKDRRFIQDRDYAEKLEAVRAVCERQGWKFRVVFSAALMEPKWQFAAIADIQSWRLTTYSVADTYTVSEALLEHGPLPLGLLADRIGGRLHGVAKLKAMMVKRIVRLDLSSPLSSQTPVALLPFGGQWEVGQ